MPSTQVHHLADPFSVHEFVGRYERFLTSTHWDPVPTHWKDLLCLRLLAAGLGEAFRPTNVSEWGMGCICRTAEGYDFQLIQHVTRDVYHLSVRQRTDDLVFRTPAPE